MTPKEKAKELVNTFRVEILSFLNDRMKDQNAKRCALIAVDEILNNFGSRVGDKTHYCNYLTIQYYLEVKQEIEKL